MEVFLSYGYGISRSTNPGKCPESAGTISTKSGELGSTTASGGIAKVLCTQKECKSGNHIPGNWRSVLYGGPLQRSCSSGRRPGPHRCRCFLTGQSAASLENY